MQNTQLATPQALQHAPQNSLSGVQQMPVDLVQFDAGKLADIQLPEAISFWPPAPGWWFLLALIIIILCLIIYFIIRKPPIKMATVKQLKSQSMKEFHAIKASYEAQPTDKQTSHQAVINLSVFLRRYALSLYNREKVASLTDKQWLGLLDKTYNSQFKKAAKKKHSTVLFSEKYADLLTQVPYQPATHAIDHVLLSELFDSTELLVSKSVRLFKHKLSLQQKALQNKALRQKTEGSKQHV